MIAKRFLFNTGRMKNQEYNIKKFKQKASLAEVSIVHYTHTKQNSEYVVI